MIASETAADRARVGKGRRNRLLLVGKDFHTKGGDLVIQALAMLRRDHDPAISLTVAGPTTWPLAGEVPDGVRFLGRIDPSAVAALYEEHDLLVMPSRMEGFGIVFVEALARGLPCVARRAFAMPEIVIDGHNGALVDSDDVAQLAHSIVSVLGDDGIYARCAQEQAKVARHFTWDRAAADTLAAVETVLSR